MRLPGHIWQLSELISAKLLPKVSQIELSDQIIVLAYRSDWGSNPQLPATPPIALNTITL
jgi:hypothetical protein